MQQCTAHRCQGTRALRELRNTSNGLYNEYRWSFSATKRIHYHTATPTLLETQVAFYFQNLGHWGKPHSGGAYTVHCTLIRIMYIVHCSLYLIFQAIVSNICIYIQAYVIDVNENAAIILVEENDYEKKILNAKNKIA